MLKFLRNLFLGPQKEDEVRSDVSSDKSTVKEQEKKKTAFHVGQNVVCINDEVLPGNDIGPALKKNAIYQVKDIILDGKKNQHLDIGLPSALNWVTSYETGEILLRSDRVHWCHPSRFEPIEESILPPEEINTGVENDVVTVSLLSDSDSDDYDDVSNEVDPPIIGVRESLAEPEDTDTFEPGGGTSGGAGASGHWSNDEDTNRSYSDYGSGSSSSYDSGSSYDSSSSSSSDSGSSLD